jgi:hypothetical protein
MIVTVYHDLSRLVTACLAHPDPGAVATLCAAGVSSPTRARPKRPAPTRRRRPGPLATPARLGFMVATRMVASAALLLRKLPPQRWLSERQ